MLSAKFKKKLERQAKRIMLHNIDCKTEVLYPITEKGIETGHRVQGSRNSVRLAKDEQIGRHIIGDFHTHPYGEADFSEDDLKSAALSRYKIIMVGVPQTGELKTVFCEKALPPHMRRSFVKTQEKVLLALNTLREDGEHFVTVSTVAVLLGMSRQRSSVYEALDSLEGMELVEGNSTNNKQAKVFGLTKDGMKEVKLMRSFICPRCRKRIERFVTFCPRCGTYLYY